MSDERPTGVPTSELAVHVVLDGARLDRKLTALRAMATQTRDLMAIVDPEVYAQEVAEEFFVDAAQVLEAADPAPTLPQAAGL